MIVAGTDRSAIVIMMVLCCPACTKDPTLDPPADASEEALSNILHLDPEPDPFTTAPWWGPVVVDIDLDSVADLELRVLYEDDTTTPWPDALWGTQVVSMHDSVEVSVGSLDGSWSLLSPGDPIDGDLYWMRTLGLHSQIPGYSEMWSGVSSGYIGVRKRNGDVNYAWVQVHSGVDDIAYQQSGFERTLNLPIHAADTGE